MHHLGGDPPWLLVVSGSGNAKTETVGALAGVGAHITSTVTSEGALLAAVARRERTPDATGGLLRKIGDAGILVVKDFTSILSMNREMRTSVLAALREIHDGLWERNVGTDGGRTLTWTGRVILLGAVTTAYDAAHSVIAAMGDRFALIRMDSATGRRVAGRQALSNVDREHQMRAELATAVRDLFEGLRPERAVLTEAEQESLLGVADLLTFARTAVERDYRGDVIDAHAPEMPTPGAPSARRPGALRALRDPACRDRPRPRCLAARPGDRRRGRSHVPGEGTRRPHQGRVTRDRR